MTHRRSRKPQPPAVPASPAPGVSAEQPQTHPSRAWSPDSSWEAASNVRRQAAICSPGQRCGQCGCGLQISSLPRASWQHGARGLQARPSPLPQDTGKAAGSTQRHTSWVDHAGSLSLSPQTEQAHFTYHRVHPRFSARSVRACQTRRCLRDIAPRGRTGARAAAAHTAYPSPARPLPSLPSLPCRSQLTPCRGHTFWHSSAAACWRPGSTARPGRPALGRLCGGSGQLRSPQGGLSPAPALREAQPPSHTDATAAPSIQAKTNVVQTILTGSLASLDSWPFSQNVHRHPQQDPHPTQVHRDAPHGRLKGLAPGEGLPCPACPLAPSA